VTGWQSGGGDQGGWNQNQPFGPEAQTSKYDPYQGQGQQDPYQYGADPYAGADPYGSGQYGAGQYGSDPYGGGAGYDPYAQQYQQQYPPTGGFPAPGYGPPPPPPKRSKLPMILSLVAVVIIIGAVVAILLVNRQDNQPVAQDDNKTTTGPKSTSEGPKSGGGDHDGWISIDNSADAGLSYQVPGDWKEASNKVDTGLGVQFSGSAEYGSYACEGANYIRTFVGSGDVEGKDGADLDLATTMEDFAKSFGTTYYGKDAQVDVPTPKETKVDGKTAMTVTATVKQNVTKPNCQATEGEVAMVGVLLEQDGKPKGVAMLVVVNDTTGGPSDPKPLDPSVSQDILGTVKTN
jgi:hypothetical protein